MTTKQLSLYIGVTVVLALTLAWVIERAQVRTFMGEFETWWERKQSGKSD